MINLKMSTLIGRPVRQVFDFISTPENDFQWQYGTLASARISGRVRERGASFRSIGHLLGRRVQSTFEVTEYELDRKYGFKSLSGPLQSYASYSFEMAEGSTQIEMTTRITRINFFQVSQGILERHMNKQLRENLAMLKEVLEARQVLLATGTASLAG